ncbi:putative peripheral membrane protein [Dentipellis sp. KUC8613]|nr:putative peripheral membrane protein [Dentipellis sp. KUC8613]
MLQICRAEDGEMFQVNASLWDIERVGSLELFLHQEIGVEEDAVLAYLSDGRRLRNDNVRELAGSQDQSIFVFNKYYLDEDLDTVLHELRVEPPLQPSVEDTIAATPPFRPSQLGASYLRTAHLHHQAINHTLLSLRYQQSALRIASSSLDLNVLAMKDAFDGVANNAKRELDRQALLLAGVGADLDMLARISVHREFLSPAMQKAMDAGGRGRTLSDYVSTVKMRQVADICRKTHGDIRGRYMNAEETMNHLTEGTDEVRSVAADNHFPDDAELLVQQCQETFDRISDTVATLESPVSDSDALLRELRHYDTTLRDDVVAITSIKNAFTEQCMQALRQISLLNNDLVQLPSALTTLQNTLRAKNSFSHIHRLHNMIYAYGATVIEIVRRKEFGRFFYQRAQVILEVMAKLSASERKRRQVYRGEIHGQLPFDTRGMDDPVPSIDFSPTGGSEPDNSYSLERSDVDELLKVLKDLEQYAETLSDADGALRSIRETRNNLEKLVSKMDALESGFDRIAERSLLSSSRLASSRRRLSEVDEHAFQELHEHLRELQQSKIAQETAFNEERNALQSEVSKLRYQLQSADDGSSSERARADHLERELHQARAQADSEAAARRILEERHASLLAEVNERRRELSQALAEATDQTKSAEILRQQLAQAHADYGSLQELESRNSANMIRLLHDQEETLRKLEEAQARGENLQTQIKAARDESEAVKQALQEADKEKDRLLKAQANEHDRQMRDYVAEADGDRAVLEHQFFELRAEMEDMERQVKESTAQLEMKEADAVGLREELQRVECELREAQHVERVLREDLRAGRASQSDYEQKVEGANRLVAQLLDISIAYRAAHFKALTIAQAATSHPSLSKSVAQLGESQAFPSGSRHQPLGPLDEPSPIDPSDPLSAVELLRSVDHDQFLEVIAKTGSTIRKWQKQCKEYRERAKGKISFRNFAKGDLALFLPTRNSVSKPWAAFNVSFPHYFLQATGHLADQLKTREWIVARITSITERVVDQKDPSSNPYGLGDGVKYYMLEVEDWTQPSSSKRKAAASRKPSAEAKDENPIPLSAPPALTSGPPENEVEDTFQATRAPNSRHFPSRSRANSIPTAGPSSLSRLLAQAGNGTELNGLEPIPPSPPVPSRSPSPLVPPSMGVPASPSPPALTPPSTSQPPRAHAPTGSSPLRPGSRASRISTSSRFSAGRLPPFGSASTAASAGPAVKAAPTTALSQSPSGMAETQNPSETPSPSGSTGEGLANMAMGRRRTTSHHVSAIPGSPLAASTTGAGERQGGSALASLASWGAAFGRRKRVDSAAPNPGAATGAGGSGAVRTNVGTDVAGDQSSARLLLQKFE